MRRLLIPAALGMCLALASISHAADMNGPPSLTIVTHDYSNSGNTVGTDVDIGLVKNANLEKIFGDLRGAVATPNTGPPVAILATCSGTGDMDFTYLAVRRVKRGAGHTVKRTEVVTVSVHRVFYLDLSLGGWPCNGFDGFDTRRTIGALIA